MIFDGSGGFNLGALGETVNHATLQVEDAEDVLALGTTDAILHDDEADGLLIFHLNRVDAIDASDKTVFVSHYVLEVVLLDSLPGGEVVLSHRLDDEFLVLAEKEEAARLALRLASLEDHLAVDVGVERLAQDIVVESILLTKESKDVRRVFCHLDVLIDDKASIHLRTLD